MTTLFPAEAKLAIVAESLKARDERHDLMASASKHDLLEATRLQEEKDILKEKTANQS